MGRGICHGIRTYKTYSTRLHLWSRWASAINKWLELDKEWNRWKGWSGTLLPEVVHACRALKAVRVKRKRRKKRWWKQSSVVLGCTAHCPCDSAGKLNSNGQSGWKFDVDTVDSFGDMEEQLIWRKERKTGEKRTWWRELNNKSRHQ